MPGLEPADVIWASMSLHHIGDEAAALRLLGELLAPQGLLAILGGPRPTALFHSGVRVEALLHSQCSSSTVGTTSGYLRFQGLDRTRVFAGSQVSGW